MTSKCGDIVSPMHLGENSFHLCGYRRVRGNVEFWGQSETFERELSAFRRFPSKLVDINFVANLKLHQVYADD